MATRATFTEYTKAISSTITIHRTTTGTPLDSVMPLHVSERVIRYRGRRTEQYICTLSKEVANVCIQINTFD